MKLHHVSLATLALFALASGCAVSGANDAEIEATNGSEAQSSSALIASSNRWTKPLIPVCWMNMPPERAAQRAAVRADVGEWEHKTRIRFVGWGLCTNADNPAIRIADDSVQGNSRVGPYSTTGASMHLDLKAYGTNTTWLRESALHEFGHALGLYHEQERKGSPCRIAGDTTEQSGASKWGPFDDDSIMNYCGRDPEPGSTAVTHISPWDVYAIEQMYFGSPGFFYKHDGVYYRVYDGVQCRVTSLQQLGSFGGLGLITTAESHGGTPPVAPCAWPDGFYRAANQNTVWVSLGGTVCNLESENQMEAYGGFSQVTNVPAGTDPTAGLRNVGTCKWPGGFYMYPGDFTVYRINGLRYCAVKNGKQLTAWGGWAAVHQLSYKPAGLFAGRTYDGQCPDGP